MVVDEVAVVEVAVDEAVVVDEGLVHLKRLPNLQKLQLWLDDEEAPSLENFPAHACVLNGYGPTEASIETTAKVVSRLWAEGLTSIGHALRDGDACTQFIHASCALLWRQCLLLRNELSNIHAEHADALI